MEKANPGGPLGRTPRSHLCSTGQATPLVYVWVSGPCWGDTGCERMFSRGGTAPGGNEEEDWI